MLAAVPGVREAAVVARASVSSGLQLVAYVACDVTADVLRRALRERLPEPMVPSWFVVLESLPLTPNEQARPRRAAGASKRRAIGRPPPPRDEQELALLEIWEDLFALRTIGVKDDFFALGGHSLLAVRLMARIERQLGIRLPVAALFQAATIESLALLLKRRQSPSAPSSLVLLQAGAKRPFFCVHPAHGHVLCYFELSRRLPDRSFYGLQVPAIPKRLASAPAVPAVRIEELAES